MAAVRMKDAVILAAGLGICFWATLPPDKVAFDEACEPAGGPASFSAVIYGKSFWRAQLEAAIAERNDLLTQPARRARNAAEIEREARENPALEEKMMRLSREQGRIDDRVERERHEAALQSARLKKVAWLMGCEGIIAQKLAE